MFEPHRRAVVGQTFLDLAKILFGGQIASGFFATFPLKIRLGSFLVFVVLFVLGWLWSPPKKGG